MSKKLIAVAAAAALALTGLVGLAPANAAVGVTFKEALGTEDTGTTTRSFTTGLTASAPMEKRVPYTNELNYNLTSTDSSTVARTNSLIRIDVETPSANTTVTATATGGVRLIDGFVVSGVLKTAETDGTTLLSTDGKTTHSESTVGTGKVVDFYVYTTSTEVGTLVISYPGSSTTYYIKGLAGTGYSMSVTAPQNATTSGNGELITAVVKDVFGNDVVATNGAKLDAAESAVNGFLKVTALGAGAQVLGGKPASGASYASVGPIDFEYDTTLKAFAARVLPASTGAFALTFNLYASGTTAPANVTGLAASVNSFFATVNSISLADRVTALTNQLAVSRPKANSVTKKRWNKLVRAHRALGGTAKLK